MKHLADDAISKRRAELKKLQLASKTTHPAVGGGPFGFGRGGRIPPAATSAVPPPPSSSSFSAVATPAAASIARRLDPSFATPVGGASPPSPVANGRVAAIPRRPGEATATATATANPPKSPFGHARATIRPAPGLGTMGVPPLTGEPPSSAPGRRIGAGRKSRIPALGRPSNPPSEGRADVATEAKGADSLPVEELEKEDGEMDACAGGTTRMAGEGNDEQASPENAATSGESTPVVSNVGAASPCDSEPTSKAPTKKWDSSESAVTATATATATSNAPAAAKAAASDNLTRLADDLQRTEKEKKEALDQVAKLKRLLEGVSVGNRNRGNRGNGNTLEGNLRRMELEHRRETASVDPHRDNAIGNINGNDHGGKNDATKDVEPIPPILQQIKDILHSQGETAAIEWIHRQMTPLPADATAADATATNGGKPALPARPGGRDPSHGRGGNVLASLVPPLTPRSRPGSRAASPERGGGKGLASLSQTLLSGLANGGGGGNGGKGGSSSSSSHRGCKRGMTPTPKRGGGAGRRTAGDAREREELVEEEEDESENREFLIAAAKSIANEYWTDAATFFVRRPYVIMEDKGVIPAEGGVYGENDLGGNEYHGDGNHENNDGNTTRDNGSLETNDGSNNDNIWSTYPYFSSDEDYLRNATIKDPHSLEILAFIDADGSVLTLTGESNVRHGKVPCVGIGGSFSDEDELDWAMFDQVEDMDRSLGCVAYIDGEGNDCEYWLDDIYEDAIKVRDSYCVAISAAATALKDNSKLFHHPTANQQQNHYHPQMHSSSQGTHLGPHYDNTQSTMQGAPDQYGTNASMPHIDDIPPMQPGPSTNRDGPPINSYHTPRSPVRDNYPPDLGNNMPPSPQQQFEQIPQQHQQLKQRHEQDSTVKDTQQLQQQKRQHQQHQQEQQQEEKQNPLKESKAPPPEEFEDANSALATMLVSLFSLFFSLVWFVIKIPFQLMKNAVMIAIFAVTLKLVWLYFADDNGAWDMGAGVNYEYNMPGIH